MLNKKLKSESHHWWPRSLSKYWADEQGCVTQISGNGDIKIAPPHNFGAIKNAHHLKYAEESPWNSSFEWKFNDADSGIDLLVAWLMQLETAQSNDSDDLISRLLPAKFLQEDRERLATCLSSLIVRSPGSRNNIRVTVEHYRREFGLKDYQADKTLIAGNMHGQYDSFLRLMKARGKFIIFISDRKEFIWGDGFLHNFPSTPDLPLSPRCVVNLLPTTAVAFFRPTGMYPTFPELFTMKVTDAEVDCLNYFVQTYSGKFLYFRNDRPIERNCFDGVQYFHFDYHKHPWLDEVFGAALSKRS